MITTGQWAFVFYGTIITFVLCMIILYILLLNVINTKKLSILLAEKLSTMEDYMRTLATKYAENISYSQAVNLLNIASRVMKYKIYSYILDELMEEERDYKKENMFAKIRMYSETIIRETRADLGMFQFHDIYLTESIPKNINEMMDGLKPIIMRKTGNAHVKKKAQKTEIKEILCKYFDTITLKT